MAIGNPITLTSNVASKTISVIATAGQTLFTVTGGYRINQLAVFRNGVRLLDSRDYEARNGATVTLLSAATVGDALEFQVFDDFRVADAIVSAESEQTISGNLTVSGGMTVAGILTATDLRPTDVSLRHLKATGISTVSDTTQSTSTTSGAMIVSGGLGVAKNLFVGGSMNVAGTLTYEDVTNSETAGVTTTGGLVVTGLGATFGSGVGIADSIYHIDDSNTAIRFPAADTFTVTTAGEEALRVDSSGRLLLGTTTEGNTSAQNLTVGDNTSGHSGITLRSSPSYIGSFYFSDATSGVGEYAGFMQYSHNGNFLTLGTNSTEKLRLTSDGELFVGTISGDSTYQTHIKHDTFGLLKLETTNTSTDGSYLVLYHNSSSPADDDQLGIISFIGENDADEEIAYAQIRGFSGDVTDGTEDGYITFNTRAAGSFGERLRITSDGKIGIGEDDPDGNYLLIRAASTVGTTKGHIMLTGDSATNGQGPQIVFSESGSGSSFAGAYVGHIREGTNSTGSLVFGTRSTGGDANTVPTERLRITSAGNVGINEISPETHLHVEQDNAHSSTYYTNADAAILLQNKNTGGSAKTVLKLEAPPSNSDCAIVYGGGTTNLIFSDRQNERLRIDSSGRLLVGHTANATPYVESKVQVSATDGTAAVSIARYQNSASNPYLALVKSRGGLGAATIVQDNDGLGYIAFVGADGNDLTSEGAAIAAEVDGTPGQDDMPGALVFKTTSDGANSATERLRITSAGKIGINVTAPATTLHLDSTGTPTTIQIDSDTESSIDFNDHGGSAKRYKIGTNISDNSGQFEIKDITADAERLRIDSSGNATFSGTVSDSKGDLRKIIFKQESSAYTLVAADAGKAIEAQGNVTVPNGVFGGGDAITIINDGSSDISILKGSGLGSMFNVADGGNANLTLAGRGMATVYFVNNTTCYISGGGLS